jgi:hypothetical protein
VKQLMRHETAPTRQVVGAALTLLVLGAIGAVQAGLAGGRFMFDLEQDHPALSNAAPVLPDPHTPRLALRVFVVLVDGLRLDKSYELPFLDDVRRKGVDSEASSHYPTWSRPNYVSILTGVPPSASGVRTNHHGTPVALDSLMDRAHQAGLHTAMATDYDVLPRLFLRPRRARDELVKEPNMPLEIDPSDVDGALDQEAALAIQAPDANLESPFDDARYAPWPGGFSEAGDALAGGNDELVVMLLGAVDAAGHAHGGDSEEYRAAAQIADHALARALARIDLSQDAVIITADHGHTGRGGHGGVEPEVIYVPLIAAGAGIKEGATANDARLIDIAPTVSALLGMPSPGHGLGRTLVEILDLDEQSANARKLADQQRMTVTGAIVAGAEARAAVDVLENRAMRILGVVGGTVLALVLATVLFKRRVVRFDIRAMLVSVPAFFVVYYALIGAVGQRFSPSLLPAQGHLAWVMAKYGIIAMTVQLLFNLWALHSQKTLAERLATANGIALVGFMLAMIPAGIAWAFFPPPYTSLPGPVWLVLIPAVQVAVACAGIVFAVTLLVEVIVFAARAYYRR